MTTLLIFGAIGILICAWACWKVPGEYNKNQEAWEAQIKAKYGKINFED